MHKSITGLSLFSLELFSYRRIGSFSSNNEQRHLTSLKAASNFVLSSTFLWRNYSDDSEVCSYGQLVIGSFITTTHLLMHHVSCRVFGETSNHPGDSALLQPRFGALWLLAFPKTKITLERGETSDHRWDSGKYNGRVGGDWENCVRSQGAYFEGDWDIIVLCTVFLVSCIFFNKCLCFS